MTSGTFHYFNVSFLHQLKISMSQIKLVCLSNLLPYLVPVSLIIFLPIQTGEKLLTQKLQDALRPVSHICSLLISLMTLCLCVLSMISRPAISNLL